MKDRGLTLIEVMVTTAILSVIFLFLGITMVSASRELSVSTVESGLHMEMRQAAVRIFQELEDASAGQVNVDGDGSGISFRVPVNVAVNWGETGTGLVAEWGARLGAQETSGGVNAIRFQQATDPVTGAPLTIDEATIVPGGLNLNANTEPPGAQDASDVFAVGRLVLTYDPNGFCAYPNPQADGDEIVRPITGDWVVQVRRPTGAWGGAVSGVATDVDDPPDNIADDYLFRRSGQRIVVNLWGLRVNRAERVPVLVNQKLTVVLTNE